MYYKPDSPVWVAESYAEEEKAEVARPSSSSARPKLVLLESRPKTKAKASSSRAAAEEVEEIEEVEVKEVVSTSVRTFPKAGKVPIQKEKPSHILPDLVVLYEKASVGNSFVQTRDTRFFAGYRSFYSTEQNILLQSKGQDYHGRQVCYLEIDFLEKDQRMGRKGFW